MIFSWNLIPEISGLMLTSVPERHALAQRSIQDFCSQEWPHKDLVVLNATDIPFTKHRDVFEIRVRMAYTSTFTSFGFSQCLGDWIVDWQDDCRYASSYIQALARLRSEKSKVSLATFNGICADSSIPLCNDNNGDAFWMCSKQIADRSSLPITWLAKPELVTRYYAKS